MKQTKKGQSTVISFRIKDNTLRSLDATAKKSGVTRSALLAELVAVAMGENRTCAMS